MSETASSTSWTSFLKSIASYNGDLSSLTAPPFILSPTSLVEYSQFWGEHPDLLIAPNFIGDANSAATADADEVAQERIIAVTKWFISTLRSQYCSRNESMGSEKKPLNPFLGELFVGTWGDSTSEQKLGNTTLLSEQVSHHPPVTAYAILNDKNNIELQGYNGIKASISTTSINVKQYGHALLNFKDLDEKFVITLPPLHIEGLIVASPFVELEGQSIIQSSSGYICVINYTGRGYFSGKKNSFKARIFKDAASFSNGKSEALYTIAGQWSGKSHIYAGGSTHKSNGTLFYDAQAKNPEHLNVKPIEEQHDLESRKAWKPVADAIKVGNYDLIHQEKSKIEIAQRQLRQKEKDNGLKWENRWFAERDVEKVADNGEPDVFVGLATLANLSRRNVVSGTFIGEKEDKKSATSEHWRFVREKWDAEAEVKL